MAQDMYPNVGAGIIANLASFIIGWLARVAFDRYGSAARHQQRKRRRRQFNLPAIQTWLIDYYIRNHQDDKLYVAEFGEYALKIPFLVRPTWYGTQRDQESVIFVTDALERPSVKLNHRFIKRRADLERSLWPGPLFHLVNIHEPAGGLRLEAGVCNYYEYVSVAGPLEEETINAISAKQPKTPLRDTFAPSLPVLAQCPMHAHAIGVHAVVALNTDDGYKVLIQHRSSSMFGYEETYAVAPSFLHQPLHLKPSVEVALLHGFLREFYEELYDQEELARVSTHLSPTWFYSQDPLSTLLAMRADGAFRLEFLGFGFDPLYGDVNVALLALVDDRTFLAREHNKMKHNWEASEISVRDFKKTDMIDLLRDRRLHPGSAFALSEAAKRLKIT